MSEIQVVVGIDIAKDSVEVSTLGAPGPEGGYGNDPEGHSALIAQVPAGALVVMEAMKMEHTLSAPTDGRVTELLYAVGDQVSEGAQLVSLVAA